MYKAEQKFQNIPMLGIRGGSLFKGKSQKLPAPPHEKLP